MNIKIQTLKELIKRMPKVGPFLVRLNQRGWNSTDYWDGRYRKGGNSGAGSYNRLAVFKAEFLNRFVVQHRIFSVIEFGCGDGSQLELARYGSYVGVDVSSKAVEICRSRFSGDESKLFLQSNAFAPGTSADLVLSLDVVYHLVEGHVFETYMRQVFGSAARFVIVYSSNVDHEGPPRHIRHRQFTQWIEHNEPGWYLLSTVENDYPYDAADPENTSFANFYVFAPRNLSSASSIVAK